MKRIAVFAHYDKDGKLSNNVLKLLGHLEAVCERIIMVSTNLHADQLDLLSPKVECFVRENVGYDFYSYKFGIEKIGNVYIYDQVLLLNDSFFISSSFNIQSILEIADNSIYDICGLVDSYQFNYHVQSFFVVLKKEALVSVWFGEFWRNVTILDKKTDIIFKYEIGMSQSAMSHSLLVGSCYQWSSKSYLQALFNSYKKKNWKLVALSFFSLKYLREGNACHLLWKDIYNQFSICKWEAVRDYPEAVEYIEKGRGEDAVEVKDYIVNKASFYKGKKLDDLLNDIGHTSTQLYFSSENLPSRVTDKSIETAVVLHLFYLELLDEIIRYLKNIPVKFDLYISVVSLGAAFEVEEKFKHFTNANVYVYYVENRGRDVAPFLSLFNTGLLDKYNSVCKIHSKKSLYSAQGTNWRQGIYNELLGSATRVLSIINQFENDPHLGMIGPEQSYLINDEFWGANKERVQELCSKIGIDKEQVTLSFFAGTMFWFNPGAINSITKLCITADDFDFENGMQDGTLAHALERIFVLLARQKGYKISTTEYLDTELQDGNYINQRIPVL
ncbi:rhamnan synthesis F family protein [Paenibacillus sp. sgz500992]|uniref:rhamnan synthesis F family protein n=1 Tax=Paenibacillus sp. sgz500992 TaxID=3242476 RepID=UPI0036D2EA7E